MKTITRIEFDLAYKSLPQMNQLAQTQITIGPRLLVQFSDGSERLWRGEEAVALEARLRALLGEL